VAPTILGAGDGQEVRRVVDAVDAVAGLGQEAGVATLAARDIEQTAPYREGQQVDQAAHLDAVLSGREDRLVLAEILGVKVRRPPRRALAQKKTGSR
jgi:hypothetical protein